MFRSVKFSFVNCTATKLARVMAVRREYLAAINFYCTSLWQTRGKFDAATLKRYSGGSLGYRQKSDCLKMALETVIATKLAAKAQKRRCSVPVVAGGIRVSELCAHVETFNGAGFDYCLKLSGLSKGRPIVIPLKSHRVLQKWLAFPGATIKNGCVIGPDYVQLYVNIPDYPEKASGDELGLDIGYRKLATTSDGVVYGTNLRAICASVARKKPGSKGKLRAQKTRTAYINRSLKKLPWSDVRMLAVEDLTGLKLRTQRKEKSSKKTRKTMAPWTYRQAIERIEQLAQEHRVRLVYVDPRDTSRRCPCCGAVAKENRVAEQFRCVRCNCSADADKVGAVNILAKATGNWREDMVPVLSCAY